MQMAADTNRAALLAAEDKASAAAAELSTVRLAAAQASGTLFS
jgi:hypothetical protein